MCKKNLAGALGLKDKLSITFFSLWTKKGLIVSDKYIYGKSICRLVCDTCVYSCTYVTVFIKYYQH